MISRLFKGAVAGCAATLPMTLVMAAMAWFLPQRERDSFPPHKVMARITARVGLWQRTGKLEHTALTFLAHFGYGAAAGMLYAPLVTRLRFLGILSGVAYGILVWAAGYAGWLPAMGLERLPMHKPRSRNAQLLAAHIIWGASLRFVLDQIA